MLIFRAFSAAFQASWPFPFDYAFYFWLFFALVMIFILNNSVLFNIFFRKKKTRAVVCSFRFGITSEKALYKPVIKIAIDNLLKSENPLINKVCQSTQWLILLPIHFSLKTLNLHIILQKQRNPFHTWFVYCLQHLCNQDTNIYIYKFDWIEIVPQLYLPWWYCKLKLSKYSNV